MALTDEHWRDRKDAAKALGLITTSKDTKEIIPYLIEMVKDESSSVKREALRSLGNIGYDSREAKLSLIKALEDFDPPGTSSTACDTLMKIGPAAKDRCWEEPFEWINEDCYGPEKFLP